MAIRVETKSEIAIYSEPATVKVFDGEKLVAEVTAIIQHEQGADGGYYNVVKLVEQPIELRTMSA